MSKLSTYTCTFCGRRELECVCKVVAPMDKREKTVYRIIDRATGDLVGSYSRSYHDEFDFSSPESARTANCHGMFENREKYAIAKFRVTEELIDGDVP